MPEFFRKLQNDITQKNNKIQNDFLEFLLKFIDTNIQKLLDNAETHDLKKVYNSELTIVTKNYYDIEKQTFWICNPIDFKTQIISHISEKYGVTNVIVTQEIRKYYSAHFEIKIDIAKQSIHLKFISG